MAFKDEYVGGGCFNVSHSVGYAGANFWTDIMLVQYLIRNIYTWDAMSPFGILSPVEYYPEELPDPHKDFKALSKTSTWIGFFQTDMWVNGISIPLDNRVDRAKGSGGKITFTIHSLNSVYEQYVTVWGEQSDWMGYALKDPGMPAMLKGQLLSGQG